MNLLCGFSWNISIGEVLIIITGFLSAVATVWAVLVALRQYRRMLKIKFHPTPRCDLLNGNICIESLWIKLINNGGRKITIRNIGLKFPKCENFEWGVFYIAQEAKVGDIQVYGSGTKYNFHCQMHINNKNTELKLPIDILAGDTAYLMFFREDTKMTIQKTQHKQKIYFGVEDEIGVIHSAEIPMKIKKTTEH